MQIRPVRPEEADELGEITRTAYMELPGHVPEPDYEAELADVRTRAEKALVLVAVDDDGTLLGGVTFVPDGTSPLAEHDVPDASSIRMLAVAGAAQGRGVGEALVRDCIDRAREARLAPRRAPLHVVDAGRAPPLRPARLRAPARPRLDAGARHPLDGLHPHPRAPGGVR